MRRRRNSLTRDCAYEIPTYRFHRQRLVTLVLHTNVVIVTLARKRPRFVAARTESSVSSSNHSSNRFNKFNPTHKQFNNRVQICLNSREVSRNALTLIELVVVLSILAAIAGLVVPTLTEFTGETHGATGAASISRLDNAMRVEAASRGSVGDIGFDSLVTSAGGEVVPYLMGGGMWNGRLGRNGSI